MKTRCPSGGVLQALVGGLLGEHQRTSVEAHLTSCERCRGLLREITELERSLRAHGRERGRSAADRGSAASGEGPRGCPDEESLAAYADGSLDGRRAASVEAHLARCAVCLAYVADLMALAGAEERDVPGRCVASVLTRLDEERKTAIVRLAERSVELVRGFAGAGFLDALGVSSPAFATARGARAPLRLEWKGDGGPEVECEIRRDGGGAVVTGRVTVGRAPARALSVTLVTVSATWGPETPDARGRFGPWPLAAGRNRLVLAGRPGVTPTLELSIELEAVDGSDLVDAGG